MTEYKKSVPSLNKIKTLNKKAQNKQANPHITMPMPDSIRSKRYLYGGMLFPSRAVAADKALSPDGEAR